MGGEATGAAVLVRLAAAYLFPINALAGWLATASGQLNEKGDEGSCSSSASSGRFVREFGRFHPADELFCTVPLHKAIAAHPIAWNSRT